MKLIAPGATPEQLAAGEAAARAYLFSNGVTMKQVHEAHAVYEQWLEAGKSPNRLPPEEGADVRAVFAQAGRIALDIALPDQIGAAHRCGQLEPGEVG